MMPRIRVWIRCLLVLFPLLLPLGCADAPAPSGVVVVTLDTTRADAFGQYGNPAARTPAFDAWARSGVLARWTIADVPLTLPSHTTLWTGVPALGHGVRTNVGIRVGDAAETLAEVLGRSGFRTGAIVSTQVLRSETGIDQGFAHFDDGLSSTRVILDPSRYPPDPQWLPSQVRRADEAVELAIRWMRKSAGAPMFLWLHVFDPHSVWDPPAPWGDVAPDLYAAEIAFVDSQLGRLRREIERLDPDGGLTMVLVADHGEGLEDHREEEHGLFLYDEMMRVPLCVVSSHLPAGRIVADQVRTMDVASTILDLLGLPPELGLGGSLVPALLGEGPVPDTIAYCESLRPRVSHSGAPIKAIRTRARKFVWTARPELYDLSRDPEELTDLAATLPPDEMQWHVARLENTVREIRDASTPIAEPLVVEEETLRNLRSLGYVGGGEAEGAVRVPLTEEMDVSGLDGKDFVDVAMGGRDLDMGRIASADRKLRRFLRTATPLEDQPELLPLWTAAHQNLATVAMRLGQPDSAAVHFREALRLDSRNPVAQGGLIAALNCAGRFQAAVAQADQFLVGQSDLWRVRLHRALALALDGDAEAGSAGLRGIVDGCPHADVRDVAEFFRSKLGTDEEAETLRMYLDSQ